MTRLRAAQLDPGARLATIIFLAATAGTWIGSGIAFAYQGTAAGLIMAAAAILLIGIGLFCRRIQPLAYRLEPDALVIERRAGDRRYDGAVGEEEPIADAGRSMRAAGTGGLYGHTGKYRLRDGRSVSAHVTDLVRAEVVAVGDRLVLISPDRSGDHA